MLFRSGKPGQPPRKPDPVPYKNWNASTVNWAEFEKHLSGTSAGGSSQAAQAEYYDDEETDDDDEDQSEEDEDEE